MTSDGKNGMQIDYNALDLLGKVSSGGTTLVKYSYLADGTRTAALKPDGSGLVQRGSLTYRRGTDGSLSFEGADITGGRFTAGQVIWHVTDHLGSVVGILRSGGANPFEYNVFNAFGTKTRTQFSAPFTPEASLRFAFTGKEDQSVEFNVPYTDFGARHYSPTLTRWLTPDPLSEKYYGISPYAYCNGDPVNLVDPDGQNPFALPILYEVIKFAFFATTAAGTAYVAYNAVKEINESDYELSSKWNPDYDRQRRRDKNEADEVRKQDLKHKQMVEQNLGDPDNNDDRNNFNLRNVPSGLKPLTALLTTISVVESILDPNPQPDQEDNKADPTPSNDPNTTVVKSDSNSESKGLEKEEDKDSTNLFNLPMPKK